MTSSDVPVKDLKSLLEKSLGQKLTVEKLSWRHLTDPGENYGSVILAIDVDASMDDSTRETLRLVAKLPPCSDYLNELFNTPVSFLKEFQAYDRTFPALSKFLSDYKYPGNFDLAPKFFGGRLSLSGNEKFDEQATLVLENLTFSKYTCGDRVRGLDKDESVCAIESLAKFHAIVVALKLKDERTFESEVEPSLETVFSDTVTSCLDDMINRARNTLIELPSGRVYEKRLDKTIEYAAIHEQVPEPWGTFVHNDYWVNNMMFKKTENGIRMKMVDFQLGYYGAGTMDLIFLLMTSLQPEVLDEHLDEFLDLYYVRFVNVLRHFDIDNLDGQFSRSGYYQIMEKFAPKVLPKCIMMIPVIKAKKGSAPKMEDIKNKEAFLDCGKGNFDVEHLLRIVRIFDQKGWLMK